MRVPVQRGGFFISHNARDPSLLARRLSETGAQVLLPSGNKLVLAAWNEFPGQGLCSYGNAAIAYDVDLTNETELKSMVGQREVGHYDQGRLLLSLHQKFGHGFLDKLRGAFGLCIWDGSLGTIITATDNYGIRPVVYSSKNGIFTAASRISHIFLGEGVSSDVDPEAIYHYLFFSAICTPLTIYKDIRKLEPGKAILLKGSSPEKITYYDIGYHPEMSKGESHWVEAIPKAIRRAVASCAPLSNLSKTGCFLSGGTDSSSVVGFYSEIVGSPAKTFSIGFEDPKYNELDFARLAVRHFGAEHSEYIVTPGDVLSLIDKLPEIYDEPFGNASVVPSYYCAKMAKEAGVEVLLGGDGGDEIFGGNERYVKSLVFEKYFLIPGILRTSILEPLLRMSPAVGPFRKAQRYIRRANLRNPLRFFSYNLLAEENPASVFQPEFLAQVDLNCFLDLAKSLYGLAAPAHDTDRLMYIDMKLTITDNDLRKVTHTAEAVGVRVRYPLLDRDLVDFTTSIPPGLKVKPGRNRYIFKRAMEGFLPPEIIKKKKHGMGLPISTWFKKDAKLSELLHDTLFDRTPRICRYVLPEFITKLKYAFAKDTTAYYGDSLWVYLILELWLRRAVPSLERS